MNYYLHDQRKLLQSFQVAQDNFSVFNHFFLLRFTLLLDTYFYTRHLRIHRCSRLLSHKNISRWSLFENCLSMSSFFVSIHFFKAQKYFETSSKVMKSTADTINTFLWLWSQFIDAFSRLKKMLRCWKLFMLSGKFYARGKFSQFPMRAFVCFVTHFWYLN